MADDDVCVGDRFAIGSADTGADQRHRSVAGLEQLPPHRPGQFVTVRVTGADGAEIE